MGLKLEKFFNSLNAADLSFSGNATARGGIALSVKANTFKENIPIRQTNVTQPFEDIEGSFEVYIEGVTVSGCLYFANLLANTMDSAKRFFDGKTRSPVFLQNTGSPTRRALITEGSFTPTNIADGQTIKRIDGIVSYKRRAIIGDNVGGSVSQSNLIAEVNRPVSTFSTNKNEQPSPLTITAQMQNVTSIVPSGILLYSNQRIFAASGSFFHSSTANPVGISLLNENARFAYSVFLGDGVTGSLRFAPTSLNTIVTSGRRFVGSDLTTENNDFYTGTTDIWANVQTTFSGSAYQVSVLADSNDGYLTSTDPIIIQNKPYPTWTFLGTLNSSSVLSKNRVDLKITPLYTTSGALLLDSVVFCPSEGEGSHSVAFNQINTYQETTGDIILTSSGNNTLTLRNNYLPLIDNDCQIYPTFVASRTPEDTWKPLTYYGSLAFYTVVNDIDASITGSKDVSFMLLANGSTYNTVSGLSNWTHTNRANVRTRLVFGSQEYLDPSIFFIPD